MGTQPLKGKRSGVADFPHHSMAGVDFPNRESSEQHHRDTHTLPSSSSYLPSHDHSLRARTEYPSLFQAVLPLQSFAVAMSSLPVPTSASSPVGVEISETEQYASDSSCEFLLKKANPEYTSEYQRHGKAWDVQEKREVLPISKQDFEVLEAPALSPDEDHCICGHKVGGVRTAEKVESHSNKGVPVFSQRDGAYIVQHAPELSNPFVSLDLTVAAEMENARKPDTQGWAPVYYTVQDYIDKGYKIPPLSYECSVPPCAHFPITEALNDIHLIFKSCGRYATLPDGQLYDQARLLCLIAVNQREVKGKSRGQRRLNVHAPPSNWNDPAQIALLNRWKCQFRFRKTTERSRDARMAWEQAHLDFLVAELAKEPYISRKVLAGRINAAFGINRSAHSVTCAITRRLDRSALVPDRAAAMQPDAGEEHSGVNAGVETSAAAVVASAAAPAAAPTAATIPANAAAATTAADGDLLRPWDEEEEGDPFAWPEGYQSSSSSA
ncbi:uncharacterized protein J3D65DRAFT_601539 [Phyllosticta citribraziliensis]|uniref:Uncharacterized protein n=1 Tax=Phyllosticta citribraziliensis TaxID=989973 RepID=A0ABR1LXH8_9PEZI